MKLIDAMKYLCEDFMYLSGEEPRIYLRQIAKIEEITGCMLQRENIHGADPESPQAVYPLHMEEYVAAVQSYLKTLGR